MARAKSTGNGTTGRKQVATMPAPKLVEVRKDSFAANLEEEIRIRAYQLYEERGYLPGHEGRGLADSGTGNFGPSKQPAERLGSGYGPRGNSRPRLFSRAELDSIPATRSRASLRGTAE